MRGGEEEILFFYLLLFFTQKKRPESALFGLLVERYHETRSRSTCTTHHPCTPFLCLLLRLLRFRALFFGDFFSHIVFFPSFFVVNSFPPSLPQPVPWYDFDYKKVVVCVQKKRTCPFVFFVPACFFFVIISSYYILLLSVHFPLLLDGTLLPRFFFV